MLNIVVLYSFAYLLLMSAALFLFIFTRRLLLESRERMDRRVYEGMEEDLLEVLTAPDARRAAFAFAREHLARPRRRLSLLKDARWSGAFRGRR